MAMQIQDPNGVPGGAPANKSKFPWLIALGGCGCLTLVMLIVVGVIAYFAVGEAKTTFSEFSDGFEIESTSSDDGVASKSGKSSKSGSKSKDGSNADGKSDALEMDKVREYMLKPLTKAEVAAFHKSAAAWQKNKAFIEYEKNMKTLEKSDSKEKKSVVEGMRDMRNVGKTMTSMSKLSGAFDEHVKAHGGYEEHFSRILRISGAVAATEMMAKQHDLKDKHSDEAIKLVLKEQPEIAAEYKKGVKEAKEASSKGEEGNLEAYMAVIGGGPGAIAMARMPAATFKTWQSLSPAERKKAEEDLSSALGMTSYLGLGLHPVMLFQAAMMSELQEITDK